MFIHNAQTSVHNGRSLQRSKEVDDVIDMGGGVHQEPLDVVWHHSLPC